MGQYRAGIAPFLFPGQSAGLREDTRGMLVEQIQMVKVIIGVGLASFFAGWFTHAATMFFVGPREPRQRQQ